MFEKFKKELRDMKDEDIITLYNERQLTYFKNRNRTTLVYNTERNRYESQYPFRKLKKEIAIIMTIMSECGIDVTRA